MTGTLVDVDLFELLGDRPIHMSVFWMFGFTRGTVGGTIKLVDLYFENGLVLRNVRISNEQIVTIPAAYAVVPITKVGVADHGRHIEPPPMKADLR